MSTQNNSLLDNPRQIAIPPSPLAGEGPGVRGKSRRKSRHQAGFITIGVLVCLVVVGALVIGWARDGLAERERSRKAEQRLQAEWLAESALQRAAARLSAKSDYSGEVWKISAAELNSADGGQVEIKVAAVADHAGARRISVAADYPADPERRSRVNKEIIVGE